jgi:hypothetical protein
MIKTQGIFPNQLQQKLLHAALCEGDTAIRSWLCWKSQTDLEHLDAGSHRLLPLVYHNLQKYGFTDSSLPMLKSIYRYTWYKNRMLFHSVVDVLRTLHNAKIETMLLKGPALIVSNCYENVGLRPMNDFDVLIPIQQRESAISILDGAGWFSAYHLQGRFSRTSLDVSHAIKFKDQLEREFDLHWYPLGGCYDTNADADKDFWNDSILTSINDIPTRVPNPTDQLLHVCAHGMKYSGISPMIRWIADAMMIFKAKGHEIDWDRLILQSKNRLVSLRLYESLKYLQTELYAPVSSSVLQQLYKSSADIEFKEFRLWSRPCILKGLRTQWLDYLRFQKKSENIDHMKINFIRFFQFRRLDSNLSSTVAWMLRRSPYSIKLIAKIAFRITD